MNTLPYKSKQFFFVLIKLSIVLLALFFIYSRLTENQEFNFEAFLSILNQQSAFKFLLLIALLLLSCINWFFEILKWQALVSPVKSISFYTALKQSLGALTASLFTPNRIAEYGAKAILFESKYRKKIVFVTILGNLMQLSATVVFGILGCVFFIGKYPLPIDFKNTTLLFLTILIGSLAVLAWIKLKPLKIRNVSILKLKQFTLGFPKKTIYRGFLCAFIRYGVFSFQFFFLLRWFQIDIDYLDAMAAISTMYLLSSIIPSTFILDVVVKGSIAVYLFSFFQIEEITILSIVGIMWILNFVFPSLLGSVYVLKFKLPKKAY